jgi:NADPH-dependent glutamate synthase beta subunit-like oxidoreductase
VGFVFTTTCDTFEYIPQWIQIITTGNCIGNTVTFT